MFLIARQTHHGGKLPCPTGAFSVQLAHGHTYMRF